MADERIPLKRGSILPFPGMECEIGELVGKGSDAIVYLGSYPDNHSRKRHRVLIKELFPYQAGGGIRRDESGSICVTGEAEGFFLLHRHSFLRAIDIHLSLLSLFPQEIDGSINSYACNGTLYSVLDYTGGKSLEEVLSLPFSDRTELKEHTERIQKVLTVLSRFHDNRLLHLDISPDNILLIGSGNERVTLIDYNSVHSMDEVGQGEGIYYSTKAGFSAPEVLSGRYTDIGAAADLYSLTAVFYTCITGKRLTEFQTLCSSPPDVTDAPCMKGLSEPVLAAVKRILKKGLSPSVSRRYQDASEMKRDLDELLDRINGRGVTHWALWEAGRNQTLKAIRSNPALSYLRDEDAVYPIRIVNGEKESLSFEDFGNLVGQPGRKPLFLHGNGGVGKTTALLRLAVTGSSRFRETAAAYSYISLYGWNVPGGNGIRNRLLESLHFKSETGSFEDARHELMLLLREPIRGKEGERPKLVILLDGWNEVSGGIPDLIREIGELSALPGVRILIAGRSVPEEFPVSVFTAECLPPRTVADILSSHGILPPENDSLLELIRTPMMLSAFIRTAGLKNGQPSAATEEELLDGYIRALYGEKTEGEPADTISYTVSAAVQYVLTEAAKKEADLGRALSDRELYGTVRQCYRSLGKRDITVVFPEWMGHIGDIRGDTGNADDWYGLVVNDILWRRLGLLIRDENGCYRVFHQRIRDYLAKKALTVGGRLRKRRMVRHSVLAVFCCAFLTGAVFGVRSLLPDRQTEPKKPTYKTEYAEKILGDVFTAYIGSAMKYEVMTDCLAAAGGDAAAYRRAYDTCSRELSHPSLSIGGSASAKLDALFSSGEVMPWSGQPLREDAYSAFMETLSERETLYTEYLAALDWLASDEARWASLGEDFRTGLQAVLDADAAQTGSFYRLLMEPELAGMEKGNSKEQKTRDDYLYGILSHAEFYAFTQTAEPVLFDGEAAKCRQNLRAHAVFSLMKQE